MRARHATAAAARLVAEVAEPAQRTELGLGGLTAPDRWWLERLAMLEAAAGARVRPGCQQTDAHSGACGSKRRAAGHRPTHRPAQIRRVAGQLQPPRRLLDAGEHWLAPPSAAPWGLHGVLLALPMAAMRWLTEEKPRAPGQCYPKPRLTSCRCELPGPCCRRHRVGMRNRPANASGGAGDRPRQAHRGCTSGTRAAAGRAARRAAASASTHAPAQGWASATLQHPPQQDSVVVPA